MKKILSVLSATMMYAIATVVALAADLTNEEIAMLSGPDREAILIEGAKKEGEVVWYSTMVVDSLTQPLEDAFAAKYPFLKISSVRTPSPEVLTRAMAERDAGHITVDVMAASIADGLAGMNLTAPFVSPKTANYPEVAVPKEHTAVAFRKWWGVITWNTNFIPPEDAPKTWEDLLNPKYKGKLAWPDNPSTGGPRVITHFRKMWGDDKAIAFLKGLQEQEIRAVSGNAGSQMSQLLSGEVPMLVGIAGSLPADEIAKGAPLGVLNPNPTLTSASSVALLKDAPHPYAAMLLIDFLLDKDGGQPVIAKGSAIPMSPDVPLPEAVKGIDPTNNRIEQLTLSSAEESKMLAESVRLFNSMFR